MKLPIKLNESVVLGRLDFRDTTEPSLILIQNRNCIMFIESSDICLHLRVFLHV